MRKNLIKTIIFLTPFCVGHHKHQIIMKIWHLKTRFELQKIPQTEFEIQLRWIWCLATLSPSNGVTLVPDVRMWGEQTSVPSVQAVHQLCKGYLIFANTHMPFIKVTCSTIIWASDWLTLYVYNVNDGLSQSREISERLTLNTDDLSEDFELHHKRYYARQDPSPHQKITTTDSLPHQMQHPQWAKPRNNALVYSTCVSENSWLTLLDFHGTLHTGSSGVSKPTPLDDLLD